MKTSARNQYGVKDSVNTYLNINGNKYEQWSDFETKEDCERANPEDRFISRKIDKSFIRIYRLVK